MTRGSGAPEERRGFESLTLPRETGSLGGMLKHSVYFDGNVQSLGFTRHGRKMTAGVILPGEYHFGTEAPERMTVVSGQLEAKVGKEWRVYPAGTVFEIPGKSGLDVRAEEPAAYLCEFL
jgi:uncharacterized protein YaiE (UPF0345 family)